MEGDSAFPVTANSRATVEHSAAERHARAVTDCFYETPEDQSLQSLLPPFPCNARAVTRHVGHDNR